MGWFFKRKKENKNEKNIVEEKQPEKIETKKEKTEDTENKIQKKTADVSHKKTETTTHPKTSKARKPDKKDNLSAKTEKPKTQKQKNDSAPKTSGKKPIYRVLYDKENRVWLIKKDGAKRTIASYVTKEDALNRVKELSSSNEMSFVVHKKDGKFQKK